MRQNGETDLREMALAWYIEVSPRLATANHHQRAMSLNPLTRMRGALKAKMHALPATRASWRQK